MSSPPGSPIVSHVRDVILRHGRTLRLRPPLPDDAEAVLDFFRRLDDQSLYMRFHGTRRIGQPTSWTACSIPTGACAGR